MHLQVPNENRILYTTFHRFTNRAYNHCSYHCLLTQNKLTIGQYTLQGEVPCVTTGNSIIAIENKNLYQNLQSEQSTLGPSHESSRQLCNLPMLPMNGFVPLHIQCFGSAPLNQSKFRFVTRIRGWISYSKHVVIQKHHRDKKSASRRDLKTGFSSRMLAQRMSKSNQSVLRIYDARFLEETLSL